MIKGSIIESLGKAVTTLSKCDGIGFGYLYEGKVYESLGNGYYEFATISPFPVIAYVIDNGKAYKEAFFEHEKIVEYIGKNGIKVS